MDLLKTLLEQNTLMTLFLVIAFGYALGDINIRGFSLGVGAVLFVGLAAGAVAPKAAPPGMIGSLGLVMFLYGIGIQYGKHFFAGLTGASGRRYNLLALIALAVGAGIVWAAMYLLHLPVAYVAGMFAGSGTSTATLQAAMDAAGSNDPAIGYSVTYPFGVIGPILCMYIAILLVKPQIEAPSGTGLELSEVVIRNPSIIGRTVGELCGLLPRGVQVIAVRQEHVNKTPRPDIVMYEDNVVGLVADGMNSLKQAQELIGEAAPGSIAKDRKDLDYVRLFASKSTVVGSRLADLKVHAGEYSILHVRRGDADLLPAPDLILEYGDRVGMLLNRRDLTTFRKYFGDSIKGTTEFSYVSIGVGMVLGVILGLISFPLPGVGSVKLGLAGGPLLVSLILGKLGRTGRLVWTMPVSANLTLRNFGLTIFLAQVGMNSGEKFVVTVQQTGILFLGVGAAILLGIVLTTLILGILMRIPFDDLLGIIAGVTGNPAIAAYAARQVPTDRPDIGYAIIFPGATIVKIVIVQLLISFGGR